MKKNFKCNPHDYAHFGRLNEALNKAREDLGVDELPLQIKDDIEVAWRERVGNCHIVNKEYSVCFHQDIYGYINVKADNPTEAKRKVREMLDGDGITTDLYLEFDQRASVCNDVDLDGWEEIKRSKR